MKAYDLDGSMYCLPVDALKQIAKGEMKKIFLKAYVSPDGKRFPENPEEFICELNVRPDADMNRWLSAVGIKVDE